VAGALAEALHAVGLVGFAVVLDHGVVVADGPTSEILANESLLLEHGLA
jgi:hypothetical protein